MADAARPPYPNLSETEEFVRNLPHSVAETIVLIPPSGRPRATTYPSGAAADVAADLAAHQGTRNCYFHVNSLRPDCVNRKAKKEDIVAIRMLHVDIDDVGALSRIQSFAIEPTVTLFSGGGYQAFWFLKTPICDIQRAEELNKRIADLLGGDSCHNADRLMRLPGTLNVPDARKEAKGRVIAAAYLVREITDFGRTYDIATIEQALGVGQKVVGAAGREEHGTPIVWTADTLPVAVSDHIQDLIRFGDHVERPLGTAGATYPSRSEVVFRVACEIARAGGDENLIIGVLTNPENGVSASVLEKRNPADYALRQARQANRAVGDEWPQLSKAGRPLGTFPNALVALTRLNLRFEYDAFQNRQRVQGLAIQELTGNLPTTFAPIRVMVLHRWGFDPGKENIRDAAHTLCIENTVHPVRDYLAGLRWDGKPRVSTWLAQYLGAESTVLHSEIGEIVLVAAVRRVRKPGVKFDTILVLEGRQGSGKSTALTILAGDEHFSDQEILALDPKAQMEAVEGIWIYELGELQGLKKAETDRVKAFASRRVDRGRPAYARFREDRPRQTIFIGTTNDEQYLRDATGNRRFWPVKTGMIDLNALKRDRDQLWAEAAHLEAEGRALTLPEELWTTAAEAQEARMLDDPWLDFLRSARGRIEGGMERLASADALSGLNLSSERQDPYSAKRIVPMMRKLGWDGPKNIRIGGKVQRGYDRSTSLAVAPPDDEIF